ncbi:hypothetical protein [Fontivita pretiosa]|uniref:hypothetical protein n=1 Tax=Fontivita pretiosa TaxID=2989684 RepID=UPI003D166840
MHDSVWVGRITMMFVFGCLCVVGCANKSAMRELSNHGLALNKSRNTAFVVQTNDHQERSFDDENLIAALPALRRLPQVKRLQLTGTSITDASIARLGSLDYLQEIEVIDTAVTREGLLALKDMPELHFLLVDGDRLTEADLAAIQQALPSVDILVKQRLAPLYRFTQGPERYRRVAPF